MIGEERAQGLCDRVVRHPNGRDADEVEVSLETQRMSYTRLANSKIIQDSVVEDACLHVRANVGGAIGAARTNDLSDEGIARALSRSVETARAVGKGSFPGFAPAAPKVPPVVAAFDEATAALGPAEKAGALGSACDRARRQGLLLAAGYHTGSRELAVATSAGLRRYHRATTADARMSVLDGLAPGDSASYAGKLSVRHGDVDVLALTEEAAERTLLGRAPRAISPGVYDVLLEPTAVAELVEWLGTIGFSSRAFEDGTSFLADRLGTSVTGHDVTILDDAPGAHGHGIPTPFDAEGTPTRTLTLIDHGVGRSAVHNRMSAARSGCTSTGNAVYDDEGLSENALPAHLLMLGGSDDRAALLDRLDDGLWVTRLHYVNGMLEPRRAVMTGLTRDGLFRVKGGKPLHGVRNMRFNDSILEAFGRIDGLSAALLSVPTWWSSLGAVTVPSVLIRGLRFTGTSEE